MDQYESKEQMNILSDVKKSVAIDG
ncbi:Protein of unknown function [Bacillus cytotoxicus]|uniref:Uncharacterized protein n=1 Tax=Bacillus cytotoxicus TaxID=580165 RepID=A0AAX2CBR3_9BACI|nr:Protein of unknown function [Bacillus cytotoxicus]